MKRVTAEPLQPSRLNLHLPKAPKAAALHRESPMNLPLVLLVTTDSDFAVELQLELKDACEPLVIQRPDRVLELMADRKAAAVVIDVRESLNGGHSVDRLLIEFEATSTTSEVILLADLFCPEVIERRAATNGISIVRSGPQALVALADQIRDRLPEAGADLDRPGQQHRRRLRNQFAPGPADAR